MKTTDDAAPVNVGQALEWVDRWMALGLPDVVELLTAEVKRLQKLVDAQAIVIRSLAAEVPAPKPTAARPIDGDDVA